MIQDMWNALLHQPNTQWVVLSTMLLGIASGVLGSFALLKKQSLIGDAVAHAALPGICIAYLLIGEKQLLVLLLGATATGLLATYLIQLITTTTRIKKDAAICLILSVFFGTGIVLLSRITQQAGGNKSGLDHFIFGQAAAMTRNDVYTMAGAAGGLILIAFLLFKEWKLLIFDPDFAKNSGLPVGLLETLFSTLLVITVVIGIQAVGVILMAALLIIPAISARYWTDRLGWMVVIAGSIGACSGIIGALISTISTGLATGPLIVVTAAGCFIVSFTIGPKRGLIQKLMAHRVSAERLKEESI
ncbi:metal ABC transporter permease [Terribacillus saccharophilus]|uniref:metal ABC transporter permease n=1 Tax=Terribacillus saccharophilus TaxID=361277 RepID=UPI002989C550|nr:iron chelate uptake ABC transporter family permease subunit [Terribacillus saccharophilus]MCM3226868.1 metal ABC transporter permease [Terribacillus saccharophilus]